MEVVDPELNMKMVHPTPLAPPEPRPNRGLSQGPDQHHKESGKMRTATDANKGVEGRAMACKNRRELEQLVKELKSQGVSYSLDELWKIRRSRRNCAASKISRAKHKAKVNAMEEELKALRSQYPEFGVLRKQLSEARTKSLRLEAKLKASNDHIKGLLSQMRQEYESAQIEITKIKQERDQALGKLLTERAQVEAFFDIDLNI